MGARFGALLLDALIIAVPTVIIGILVGGFRTTHTVTCNSAGACNRGVNFTAGWIPNLIALAIGMAYCAYFVGMRGQSLGHRAVGIKVVDVNTGAAIGPGRAALRWLVLIVTGALCTLGYWSPFFDSDRRQGWHDKATRSVAIPAR